MTDYGSKKGILVVDDEPDFRRLLRDHFEDRKYEVLEAEDGIQALEVYDGMSDEIDLVLVITDIRMPRMDGEELIRELRKRHSYLPILGVTGHQEEKDKIKLLSIGAFYFLEKPVPAWKITERLTDNAIRLFLYEREVHAARAKEVEISRILRSYLVGTPVPEVGNESFLGGIDLEIRIQSIDTQRPGGDLAEWFRPRPSQLVFYLADAMGHDLVACFMACLHSMVLHRSHHGQQPSIDQLARAADQALRHLRSCGALGANSYLSCFMGSINLEFREMIYINAGHPDAFLLRPGREPKRLRSTCRPIGYLSDQPLEIGRERLHPGDLLFVYTDGASEMLEDDSGKESGIKGLEAIIYPLINEPLATSLEKVEAYLRDFLRRKTGSELFEDDTTLMAIRVVASA